jgi:hypothetical protein
MIPILVCLVINIVSELTMSWFFVVIASLCVAASLIVVPLMVPRDKLFWTFCAFCVSLMVLLAVTCLYTGGDWFWIASSGVLFGLSVIFLPFLIRARPLRRLIGSANCVLIVIGVDVALFINLLNMISTRGHLTLNSLLFSLAVIGGIAFVIYEIVRKTGAVK